MENYTLEELATEIIARVKKTIKPIEKEEKKYIELLLKYALKIIKKY